MRQYMVIAFLACLAFLCFRLASPVLFSVPKGWPQPVYDFSKNPLTQEKILLGRMLFYDPVLSVNETVSCASCHSPYNAFTHADHALSHGIFDRIGTRNSPALMNLAWHPAFMWDGAIHHLDVQALAPISNPDEMGESADHVVKKLNASSFYRRLFFHAWADSNATGERFLKSLSQFMLTLVSANSKYDSVMCHESVFNAQQQRGYMLFKKNCNSCHAEPLFTNLKYENNGLEPDSLLMDQGRKRISQQRTDSLKFKVPTLRNIEYSFPYMHDGRFKTLQEVFAHYTKGIHQSSTLAKQLRKSIVLTSEQRVDLMAFLLTLSDKSFIFSKQHSFPMELLQKQ